MSDKQYGYFHRFAPYNTSGNLREHHPRYNPPVVDFKDPLTRFTGIVATGQSQ